MKKGILLISIIISIVIELKSQNVPYEVNYPDTLWSETDSFYVQGKSWENAWGFSIINSDTIDLGTDGYLGMNLKVWTDLDTVTIQYVNSPSKQWVYIPIASKRDTAIYRLRFNPHSTVFSNRYVIENRNKATYEIPETYELANIILYLSECSNLTSNHPDKTEYSKKVNTYFQQFRKHPLIKLLNSKCQNNNHWDTYYGFRENSVCFSFNHDNLLKYDTPYKEVLFDNSNTTGGEFRNLLYLIQDFSNSSNFRKFYSDNLEYYELLINRQSELQPVKQMWDWLENEFPQRFNSYKIIFSPLIIGSHSTQQFHKGSFMNPVYQECLMFVNSSESIDKNESYSEKTKEGLMSGIVFTEIDHNYVNPTSDKFSDKIFDLMSNKDFWATKEAQNNYSSELTIFNEYMTHSIFCLFVEETIKDNCKELIISKRTELMNKRGFTKFEQFNNRLISYLKNREKSISEMYSDLINEMEYLKR